MSNTCKSCNASIVWSKTKLDRPMPLDALPTEAGTFFLSPGGTAVHVDAQGEFAAACRASNAPRYSSHFSTCPEAAKHRKIAVRAVAQPSLLKPAYVPGPIDPKRPIDPRHKPKGGA